MKNSKITIIRSKNIIILFLILSISACKKDETAENFDTISGVLTAGENVSVNDLAGIEVYLSRLPDSADLSQGLFYAKNIESIQTTTTLDANGAFSLKGIKPGNYALAVQLGYLLYNDTILTFNFTADKEYQVQKTIDRLMVNNTPFPPIVEVGGLLYIYPKFYLENNSSDYSFTMDVIKVIDDTSGDRIGITSFPFTDYGYDGTYMDEQYDCEYRDATIMIFNYNGVNTDAIVGPYSIQMEFSIYDNSGQFLTKITSPQFKNHPKDPSAVPVHHVLDYLTIDFIQDEEPSLWQKLFGHSDCNNKFGHFYISTNQ